MTGGYPATRCVGGKEDAVADVALIGDHRPPVGEVNDAAEQSIERRRVDGARRVVAAAAAVSAEKREPLLCERLGDTLVGEPPRVPGIAHDGDGPDHVRMLDPAELRAFELIAAGAVGLEPEGLELPRHHVVLQAECRDVEAMDHVLRGEDHLHDPVDGDVYGVDLALPARMLDLPHPLLADDVELELPDAPVACRGTGTPWRRARTAPETRRVSPRSSRSPSASSWRLGTWRGAALPRRYFMQKTSIIAEHEAQDQQDQAELADVDRDRSGSRTAPHSSARRAARRAAIRRASGGRA